jgi:hypothetical protein
MVIARTSQFLCGLLLAISFISCDKVEEPIVPVTGVYLEELYGPAPSFQPEGVPHQRVLLEDFTGHDCGNCPLGHNSAAQLLENYHSDIAVVAIHAGSLAEPFLPDYPNNWTTPEGQYYLLTQIGQDLMPIGRINRIQDATAWTTPPSWPSQVADAIDDIPKVNIQIKSNYQPTSNHWNVHVFSEWLEDSEADYKLVVMLTESGITAPQLFYNNNPEYIEDYHHEHMLRTTGTGAIGLPVFSNPRSGTLDTQSYTFEWNSSWVPENCEVIAFLTEGDNGRVVNVAKVKLVP